MQSKKVIFAAALLVFSLCLFVFTLGSPKDVLGVVQDSQCIPNSCGTSEGTKQEPVYKKVCDKGCPTKTFKAERYVCPNGYSLPYKTWCFKMHHPLMAATKETFGPIEVQYGTRSQDPNKCHRPNVTNPRLPEWAKDDYNTQLPEHLNLIDVNCRQEIDGYKTVACNDAPIIACEEKCPTECGYEGGFVPNGQGGYKECPATNSCSTHRWCFPDKGSSTGYLAKAISVDITPKIGKPWESGKMIDKYCSYVAEGVCSTECGYKGGDEVPDGQGGYKVCPATLACVDDTDDEGDVLGIDDKAEVKGTTTVVHAPTAGEDNVFIYFIEIALITLTSISLVHIAKDYLNRN